MTTANLTDTRRMTVGVADLKAARGSGLTIVTPALGSGLGVSMYDPGAQVGGILHFMLPESRANAGREVVNPCMYADTGIPHLIDKLESLGASRERMIVKVAGGAQFVDHRDLFAIGKRNHAAMRKVLAQEGLHCESENVGGTMSRTLHLELGTGRVWFDAAGKETDL